MNLLLLEPEELDADGTARLAGRRARHAHEVLGAAPGRRLRAGVVGGPLGDAEILAASRDEIVLRAELRDPPPPRPGIDLLLAMPRPKVLARVLPAVASLGIDRLVLLNAARVEKPYFSSDVLRPERLRSLLVEGLEQARDTRLPDVAIRPLFRPFVEDELAAFTGEGTGLLAHPGATGPLDEAAATRPGRIVLAVGPEGGWVDFELGLLAHAGFVAASAGPRPLRVEVAVPYLLGVLAGARASRRP